MNIYIYIRIYAHLYISSFMRTTKTPRLSAVVASNVCQDSSSLLQAVSVDTSIIVPAIGPNSALVKTTGRHGLPGSVGKVRSTLEL